LDRVVRDVCLEMGDVDYKLYTAVLRAVVLGYKDLHINVIPYLSELSVKTGEYPIDSARSVTLPDDFIYPVKVGLCVGGRIAVLHLDNSLCLDRNPANNCPCSTAEEAVSQIESICCGGSVYGDCYTFHDGLGERYGYGGTYSGYGFYKYDKTANRISFNSDFAIPSDATLIVEFKSDGISDGLKYIPTEAELAVREFALSRMYMTKNLPSQARYCRKRYEVEYARLKKLYGNETIDSWRQMLLRSIQSSPKR